MNIRKLRHLVSQTTRNITSKAQGTDPDPVHGALHRLAQKEEQKRLQVAAIHISQLDQDIRRTLQAADTWRIHHRPQAGALLAIARSQVSNLKTLLDRPYARMTLIERYRHAGIHHAPEFTVDLLERRIDDAHGWLMERSWMEYIIPPAEIALMTATARLAIHTLRANGTMSEAAPRFLERIVDTLTDYERAVGQADRSDVIACLEHVMNCANAIRNRMPEDKRMTGATETFTEPLAQIIHAIRTAPPADPTPRDWLESTTMSSSHVPYSNILH